MVTHRLQLPSRILTGRDIMRSAAREIRRTVGKRILMITETGLADSGAAEAIRTGFEDEGLSVVLYTGVGSRSVSTVCEDACDIGRAGFVEAVVGFGAAPTMNLARLTGALLGGGDGVAADADDVLDAQRAEYPGLPFVAVPSLPFDPFLCSTSCLVIDARNRVSRLVALQEASHMVLFDSDILETMTRKQGLLATSASLLLCLEGVFSRNRSPVADPLNRRCVEQAVEILTRAGLESDEWPADEFVEAVRDLSFRSAFAAASGGPGLGPGTALCAEVHARTGLGLPAAAPTVTAPLLSAFMERFPAVAGGLHVFSDDGSTGDSSTGDSSTGDSSTGDSSTGSAETRVRELLSEAGLHLRLREVGVEKRDVSGIPGNVDSMGGLGAYGGVFGEQDVASLLDSAL